MMVPSRSIKTAGDFALVEVMFEAGDQFVTGDSCRAQFPDDYRTGVIRNLRSFQRRRVAYKRECEHRDGGVPRAGYIENVARLRRDVVWSLAFLKKHHSMFAEGDEQILHAPP